MQFIKDGVINDGSFLTTVDGTDIFNPSYEDFLDNGWEEYVEENLPAPKVKLDDAKQEVIIELENYFKSSAVSGFYLDNRLFEIPPVQDRVNFKIHLQVCKEKGIEKNFNVKGTYLTVDQALDILDHLIVYMTEAYRIYLEHIENIKNLSYEVDVRLYDFTRDFPELPRFYS